MELSQLLQLSSSHWSTATPHAGAKLDLFRADIT